MLNENLVRRNKQLMDSVASQAGKATLRLVPDLSKLGQQEAGAVIRTVATGTVDQFGNVATLTAAQSYDAMRASRVTATSIATSASKAFKASPVALAVPSRVEPVVGASMALVTQDRWDEAVTLLASGVDRAVANLFRETIAGAVTSDGFAKGFQRVASPTACAFCLMVCLNEYTSFDASGGYHNDCRCDTVPIFRGDSAYHPDYYDTFKQVYDENVTSAPGSTATSAQATLSAIRQSTGRR